MKTNMYVSMRINVLKIMSVQKPCSKQLTDETEVKQPCYTAIVWTSFFLFLVIIYGCQFGVLFWKFLIHSNN